jgi:polygalacturonase
MLNILDYGALPDGQTKNTAAIQRALDAAAASGETVLIPSGVFLTGSLNLKGASLLLERGAVLKGSPDIADYPPIGYRHNEMGEVTSLLYCLRAANVRISGSGTIDFNGSSFYDPAKPNVPAYVKQPLTPRQVAECTYSYEVRVNQPIFFYQVEGLVIEGITLLDSSCWTMSFSHCRNVTVRGLTIDTSLNIPNNDGMHFSACDGVFIQGCRISSGDDCIALSSITDWAEPCQNFVISDCILRSCSKALVLGYMYSHIRNVTVTNCVIHASNRGFCIMSGAGVGLVENVTVNNLTIETQIRAGNWWGNGEPIFLLGVAHDNGALSFIQSQKPARRTRHCIRNVFINNVVCQAENAIGIVGDGDSIQGVTLSNLRFAAKPSANLGLKGRTLDTSPAPVFIAVPENCYMRIAGAPDVTLINVLGDTENGVDQIVSTALPPSA